MQAKLDTIIFSSLHEAYKNYGTYQNPIAISGTVANGATVNFSTIIAYTRGGTRADVYYDGNNVKILANQSSRFITGGAYQFISTEAVSSLVEYDSDSINITISVFNGTGADIVLTPQTITVSAVVYDAPFVAI